MLPRSKSWELAIKKKIQSSNTDPHMKDEEELLQTAVICGSARVNPFYIKRLEKEDGEPTPPSADKNGFYTPFYVNEILANWFAEEKFFQITKTEASICNQNTYPVFHVYQNNDNEEIVVFNVVRDKHVDGVMSDLVLPTLDAALNKLTLNLDYKKIIIPLVETGESRHFRLLVIERQKDNSYAISYYDSRAQFVSNATNIYNTYKKLNFFQAPTLFNKDIENICKKYFVEARFSEVFLGHQPYLNATECGPLTVEYLRLVVEDKALTSATKISDAQVIREWHKNLALKLPEHSIESEHVSRLQM